MNALETKLNKMTSGELWDVLVGIKDNFSDEAMSIYAIALNALETKVTEEKFIELCEKLG